MLNNGAPWLACIIKALEFKKDKTFNVSWLHKHHLPQRAPRSIGLGYEFRGAVTDDLF